MLFYFHGAVFNQSSLADCNAKYIPLNCSITIDTDKRVIPTLCSLLKAIITVWFRFFNKLFDDTQMTKNSMNPDAVNTTSREGQRPHAFAHTLRHEA